MLASANFPSSGHRKADCQTKRAEEPGVLDSVQERPCGEVPVQAGARSVAQLGSGEDEGAAGEPGVGGGGAHTAAGGAAGPPHLQPCRSFSQGSGTAGAMRPVR